MKNNILTNSKELFLKYGIRSVTMDDISRELGMSKKTLYQYVNNKEELIHLIIKAHIEEEKSVCTEISIASKNAISEMFGIAKHVLETLRKIPPTTVYDLKKYYGASWKLIEDFHKGFIYNSIKKNIERGVEEKFYRANLDADIIAKLYVGKSTMLSDESVFPPNQYRQDELFKYHFLYHIHGVATEKGIKKMTKHLESVEKDRITKSQK